MANDRLIYAEQAKTLIKNYGMGAISDGRQMLDPVDDIILLAGGVDLIPAADAVPVVRGRWIRRGNEMRCSRKECRFIYYSNHDDFSYCPNCGAKMDGGADCGR